MSTQQILNLDSSTLLEKFRKQVIINADKEYFKRYFNIGEGFDYDKALFFSNLEKIVCTDNCELSDWIKKKLEGKLEDLKIKRNKNNSLQDLLNIAQKHFGCADQTEACCNLLDPWQEIGW